MFDILNLPRVIEIGYTDTNRQNVFEFDMSAWMEKWPDAVFSVWVQRPGEDEFIPRVSEMAGNVLVWTVEYADTEKSGKGTLEIHAAETGEDALHAKTPPVQLSIKFSGSDHTKEPPEVYEPYTRRIEQAGAAAQQAAEAAAESERVAREAVEHLADKVDAHQGAEHAGKILGIDENGDVKPVPGGQGGGGNVDSVNGVLPDENKNVAIDADDILIDLDAENPETLKERFGTIADEMENIADDLQEMRELTTLSVVGEDATITITAHGMRVDGEEAELI